MPEEQLQLDEADVTAAVSLAINPQEGRPFTFGGRDFALAFLTCEGEDRLVNLLMPRIKQLIVKGLVTQNHVMKAIGDLLPQATAIILGDYTFTDGAGSYDAHLDTMATWVRTVRGPALRLKMYEIVAAQFEMNELGKLLSGLLQTDAMLSAPTIPEA